MLVALAVWQIRAHIFTGALCATNKWVHPATTECGLQGHLLFLLLSLLLQCRHSVQSESVSSCSCMQAQKPFIPWLLHHSLQTFFAIQSTYEYMNSISCTTEVYVEYKLFWYRLVCTVLVKLHVPSRSNLADGLCLFSYSSYHMNPIGHR